MSSKMDYPQVINGSIVVYIFSQFMFGKFFCKTNRAYFNQKNNKQRDYRELAEQSIHTQVFFTILRQIAHFQCVSF